MAGETLFVSPYSVTTDMLKRELVSGGEVISSETSLSQSASETLQDRGNRWLGTTAKREDLPLSLKDEMELPHIISIERLKREVK